jgi:hypothetical protein
MSDPVPAITEAEATGETAQIYADIRRVYGVGVVNLVWRHLATFPGALPWAWETVRPLYADGTIRREAAAWHCQVRPSRTWGPYIGLRNERRAHRSAAAWSWTRLAGAHPPHPQVLDGLIGA